VRGKSAGTECLFLLIEVTALEEAEEEEKRWKDERQQRREAPYGQVLSSQEMRPVEEVEEKREENQERDSVFFLLWKQRADSNRTASVAMREKRKNSR
jgi:hypothetical protein